MDAWFVWTIILLVIALLAFVASFFVIKEKTITTSRTPMSGPSTKRLQVRSNFRKIILAPLALALITFIVSCWVIVGTNQVGIFTSMGAPYTATDNGFEMKRPWAKKIEFDGSRQFLRFCNEGNNDTDLDRKVYPGVSTKIDGNAKATLCGTIAWQMRATTPEEKKEAIELFRQYKAFERVSTNLVYPGLKVAIGNALSTLNPLVTEKNMSVADINRSVLEALKGQISGTLQILSADIAPPDYDNDTDAAIAADLAQKAKTSLEREKKLTNEAAAAANAAINNSIQDPKILINKCLDIAKELGYNPGLCMISGGQGVLLDGSALNKKP